jgi:hypothetical protein
MVNFRFHLVSITAVFLALALGIVMGATVIDRQTVDLLNTRLKSVESRLTSTDNDNRQLHQQVDNLTKNAKDATRLAVSGRLDAVPVLIVAMRGINADPVNELRKSLADAGAVQEGVVWLTGKFKLDQPADQAALSRILTSCPGVGAPDELRTCALNGLASGWMQPSPTDVAPLAAQLKNAGFLTYDPPTGGAVTLDTVPLRNTRVIVVSSSDAPPDAPNTLVAIPFASKLAQAASPVPRVVAADIGKDATKDTPAARAAFVGPLRTSADTSGRISTVDNLEDVIGYGRVATIWALAELDGTTTGTKNRVGHYGVGPGSDRFLPDLPS